jgi:hypothetical protein
VSQIEAAVKGWERVGSTTKSCGVRALELEEVQGHARSVSWGRIQGRSVGWLVGLDRWVQVIDYWSIILGDE